jgi:hypothetical protein
MAAALDAKAKAKAKAVSLDAKDNTDAKTKLPKPAGQSKAVAFAAWLKSIGVDYETVYSMSIFHNLPIDGFGFTKMIMLNVDPAGSVVPAKRVRTEPIVVEKGSTRFAFYALDEIRMWYVYCMSTKRNIEKSGQGLGLWNRSYFSRISPTFRQTFASQKTGLPVLKKAFQLYFDRYSGDAKALTTDIRDLVTICA